MLDPRNALEVWAMDENHGTFSRADALAAGLTTAQIDRRVRRGQWQVLGPRGWYVLAGKASCPLAQLCGATRALDAPAWGRSALALVDLTTHPQDPMVAAPVRYSGRGLHRVSVVDIDELPRCRVQGIQTVTPAVAVAAAARWHRNETELQILIDKAIGQGVTTWAEIERVLRRFPRMGRGGSVRVRNVLEDRLIDGAVALSAWSRWFLAGLSDAGIARPCLEYRVLDGAGRLVAQVDLAYPTVRYAIELDSRTHHLNEHAFELDRDRDGNLARLGWQVRRFTWKQWDQRRRWVMSVVRSDLAQRSTVFGISSPGSRGVNPFPNHALWRLTDPVGGSSCRQSGWRGVVKPPEC